VASGSKTVIVRSADGESFGYGAVASKDDGTPSFDGEDFSTYTLSNPNGSLSLQNSFQLNFTALEPQHNVYLNKDFGSTVFTGDIEIHFEMKIDSFQNDAGFGAVGLSQGDNVESGMRNTILTQIYATSSSNLRIGLRYFDSGGYDGDEYDNYSTPVIAFSHYYYRFRRLSTVAYLHVYSDSEMTNLVNGCSYIGVTDNYSKLIILASLNSAGRGADINGYVKNVKIISM
jgi:hypothetical protein